MGEGAAVLVLSIVLGGFMCLLAMTLWDYRKAQADKSIKAGNQRIRREIAQHVGEDE